MRRSISVAAGALVALLALTPAAGAHTYGGESAKGGAMDMRASPDFKRLLALSVERELRCRKGRFRSFRSGIFVQRTVFVRVSGSRFRGSVRVRGARGSLIRRGRFSIRGRFTNGQAVAHGVFRERSRLRDGTRCSSGRVRFFLPVTSTGG